MKDNAALKKWLTALSAAVTAGTLVKATLTKPTAQAGDLKSIEVRPIMVKRELKLSFTYHHQTRDIVKNYLPAEATVLLTQLLKDRFATARLYTVSGDWLLAKPQGQWALTQEPASQTQAPALTHDRAKQRLIESSGQPYLHALGLTDAQGKVLQAAQDKFRQINKYIEIVGGLVKQLPPQEVLRVVDMGCGKGYLTFALYDYLVNTLKLRVEMVGVEFRPELVSLCNQVAQQAGFTQLTFKTGAIADHDCRGVHMVIALHACDTATDDALFQAIQANAKLIIVAPCCQKQIRREMVIKPGHPLDYLLRYGTYMERMAEMVTDGLRAQLLELQGYETNLFEFVADAHTPKNVMITALKTAALKPSQAEKVAREIAAAKAQFGIKRHYLEERLAGNPAPLK